MNILVFVLECLESEAMGSCENGEVKVVHGGGGKNKGELQIKVKSGFSCCFFPFSRSTTNFRLPKLRNNSRYTKALNVQIISGLSHTSTANLSKIGRGSPN